MVPESARLTAGAFAMKMRALLRARMRDRTDQYAGQCSDRGHRSSMTIIRRFFGSASS